MTVSQRAQLYVMLEFSLFCVKCAVNVFFFFFFFFVFISFYFLVVFYISTEIIHVNVRSIYKT